MDGRIGQPSERSRALEEHPPRAYPVFVMYRCEGLTLKEIGERLGVSTVMARKYLMRAIKYCTRHLEDPEIIKGAQHVL